MKQKGLLLSFKHFTDSILLKMAVITLDSHREAACRKKLFPFLPMPLMIKKKKNHLQAKFTHGHFTAFYARIHL